MQSGIFLILGVIVIGVFAFGCWIGARSFETRTSKVIAGILCGLGAVAIVGAIAFGGCLFLLRDLKFH